MNTIVKYILSALIGSAVGFIGGLQGIAGGFYIAMLLLFSGIATTQRQAAGTTLLAIVFPISIGAVFEYHQSGDVLIIPAFIIAAFYMVFALLGAKFGVNIDEESIHLSLGILLFLTSLYYFNKSYNKYNKYN